MNYTELTAKDLEDLREQIIEYYETYYAELRSGFSNLGSVERATVPDFLRGYRWIITEMGSDGVVITHWPARQDSFDFHISPDYRAKDLAAEQCGGEKILDYSPDEDFGAYKLTEPLKLVVGIQEVWRASWTRLDISSKIDTWSDADKARRTAWEDLAPYLKAIPTKPNSPSSP